MCLVALKQVEMMAHTLTTWLAMLIGRVDLNMAKFLIRDSANTSRILTDAIERVVCTSFHPALPSIQE